MITYPTVKVLHHTPLWVTAHAIRECWQSHEKSDTSFYMHGEYEMGAEDCALIDRVGNKFKHASTLEHVYVNFQLLDISRALLQELARHRMASLSVKSTRYTLKELKTEEPFVPSGKDIKEILAPNDDPTAIYTDELYKTELWARASKYIVGTGVSIIDYSSIQALENLRKVLALGISNDKAKYCLPESYKTQLTWTINIRSLQNFIYLRSDKSALWEIRNLANEIYNQLPKELQYLFDGHLKKYVEEHQK